ncbi:unnamed protein product, partial [Ectocarpus sp. 12 AP-2014]
TRREYTRYCCGDTFATCCSLSLSTLSLSLSLPLFISLSLSTVVEACTFQANCPQLHAHAARFNTRYSCSTAHMSRKPTPSSLHSSLHRTDTTGKPRGDKMCFTHKTPTMISLNATHCKYAGCRRSPSYGCVSESTKGLRIFCSEHGKGKKGMSNVKDKRCAEPECRTLANYGFGKSTYCGLHKKNGMSKRAASAAASVMRGPVASSPESAATVVDTSPASVTVREEDSVGESGQRPASAVTGSVQDSVVNTTATTAAG